MHAHFFCAIKKWKGRSAHRLKGNSTIKKLLITFLIILLPVAQSFAGQASVNVTDLDYAFSSAEIQVGKQLSASEMQATEGEFLFVAAVVAGAIAFGVAGYYINEALNGQCE